MHFSESAYVGGLRDADGLLCRVLTHLTKLWGIICNLFLVLKAAAFTCPANLLPHINLCVSENYLIFPIMPIHLMKGIYLQSLHSLSLQHNSYSKYQQK